MKPNPAINEFVRDLGDRWVKLYSTDALVHSAYTTGKNLGLSEVETLKLVVVMLGEASSRLLQLAIEKHQQDGRCVIISKGGTEDVR